MKITFLNRSLLLIASVIFISICHAQTGAHTKRVTSTHSTNSYLYVDNDSSANPVQTHITYRSGKQQYDIKMEMEQVTGLYVDNRKIPTDSFYLYNGIINKVKDQVKKDIIQAEKDRQQAEKDRLLAEEDRKQAEYDQQQAKKDVLRAEEDRKQAEHDQERAKTDRVEGDENRRQAEKDREQSKKDMLQADADKKQVVKDREQANLDRKQAEKDRKQANLDRKQAEEDRALIKIFDRRINKRTSYTGRKKPETACAC